MQSTTSYQWRINACSIVNLPRRTPSSVIAIPPASTAAIFNATVPSASLNTTNSSLQSAAPNPSSSNLPSNSSAVNNLALRSLSSSSSSESNNHEALPANSSSACAPNSTSSELSSPPAIDPSPTQPNPVSDIIDLASLATPATVLHAFPSDLPDLIPEPGYYVPVAVPSLSPSQVLQDGNLIREEFENPASALLEMLNQNLDTSDPEDGNPPLIRLAQHPKRKRKVPERYMTEKDPTSDSRPSKRRATE